MKHTRHRWRITDDDFPIQDAQFLEPFCKVEMPKVLHGLGARPDAFDAPRVAIVGTRAATMHGLDDARDLARVCAQAGVTVISGLALGIDGAAHEGALDGGGLTVGVVATGLDVEYPRRHKKLYEQVRQAGVIVTEHDDGVQPLPYRFPIRNRIIAALAEAVVVVEAMHTGGALSTARYARQLNRDVFAIPGSRRNNKATGCNELIRDGAIALVEPGELLERIGCVGSRSWIEAKPLPEDPDERAVIDALAGDPASIDELRLRSQLDGPKLGVALRGLENSGRLQRRRGMWWPV